jgi:hypothetical protein
LDHRQWGANRNSTQDPGLSLAVGVENLELMNKNGRMQWGDGK